jgi:predicted HD superfamily hydrolase involved in NAD metabolism
VTGIDRAAAERLIAARLSPRRRDHAHRVAAEAAVLAQRFGASEEKAEIAGLLHDYCRELTDAVTLAAAARYAIPVSPVEARRPKKILHGPVAAAELAELGLDAEVASAIRLHTIGAAGMTTLEKCVYLADYLEPGRDFPGVDEVRELAATSLDRALGAAVRLSLLDIIGRGRGVVPGALALYNETHAEE